MPLCCDCPNDLSFRQSLIQADTPVSRDCLNDWAFRESPGLSRPTRPLRASAVGPRAPRRRQTESAPPPRATTACRAVGLRAPPFFEKPPDHPLRRPPGSRIVCSPLREGRRTGEATSGNLKVLRNRLLTRWRGKRNILPRAERVTHPGAQRASGPAGTLRTGYCLCEQNMDNGSDCK